RTRPSRGRPRVSIVVPCFNHGRWLEECLASVRAQTYPDIETIVVDDGSTDPDTRDVLDRLEDADDLRLIRLERNSGPSAARNRAIDACTGRYVLPLDADNQLVPDALDKLVGQLQLAGETVGFVYQNLQHFGNREDYFEAPDYNLHTLLALNYCDTSSLIDREVFDAGIRFDEDVVDGHEDWDFFLNLAERDVHGEPARARTLLFRKHGFSRSERIDHAARLAREAPKRRAHPRVKARWAPALSVIALSALRDDSPDSHLLPGRM